MPKQINNRLPALNSPLIALSLNYLPTKSAVLRHLFYFRQNQKHGLAEDLAKVYSSVKDVYDALEVPIRPGKKVKAKIKDLFNEYDNKICKNVHKKETPCYRQFRASLREVFDVKLTSKQNKSDQPAAKEFNQFNSFETVSWEGIVISSSEEDEEDEEDEVVDIEYGQVVSCALQISKDYDAADPDFVVNLRTKMDERVKKKMILSHQFCNLLDRIQLSSNSAFRLIAKVLNELNVDLSQVVFSVSTIHRYRRANRDELLEQLKSTLVFPEKLVLHWDGVNLFDIFEKKFCHHLIIKVTGVDFEQIIKIERTPDSGARTFVRLIIQQLQNWQIFDRITFLNFDTTAVNTGKLGGVAALLEQAWPEAFDGESAEFIRLNCRHHEHELYVAKSMKALFPTAGARYPFLDRFQASFDNLDKQAIDPYCGAEISTEEKSDLLSFIRRQEVINCSNSEYRQLLEA